MATELFSQDVVPIGTGYLILMGVLAAGLRLQRREAAKSGGQEADDAASPDGQASHLASEGQPGPAGQIVREARKDREGQDGGEAGKDREGQDGSEAREDREGQDGTGPGGKKPGLIARQFPPGWPRFGAEIASVALGGYLLLISVDILYYYGVARVAGQFLDSAISGSALLIAICLPLYAGASWLDLRRRKR
jgi:hypothetical protein